MAKPGELSLASGGILFLDELPHFGRKAIDILRQPLEERRVTVTRVHGNYEFPADFLIVAAINPCPCGFYPDMPLQKIIGGVLILVAQLWFRWRMLKP